MTLTIYPPKILHIMLTNGATSMPYNEHSLAQAHARDITICTYFQAQTAVPNTITHFTGNGSLRGFITALRAALHAADYDIIHLHSPHVALLFLLATLNHYRRLAPRTVFTVHNCYPNYEWRHVFMLLPVFALFQHIVCCSRASYESFPPLFKWLAGNRLSAIPNGIDIARVDSARPKFSHPAAPAAALSIVSISRLVALKNPTAVLSAFSQALAQPATLTILGKGPLRKLLLAEAQKLAPHLHLSLPGIIPRDDVYRLLATADIYISTSRGEGLPLSVLEAMACGCPVILSDIAPHREIAADVNFIPLIHPDDIAGFARELARYSEMSTAERQTIGRQCRQLAESRFSLDTMHAAYGDLYRRIIQATARAEVTV